MDSTNQSYALLNEKKLFIFDMDGTIYLGNKVFPFAIDFIKNLRKNGKKVPTTATILPDKAECRKRDSIRRRRRRSGQKENRPLCYALLRQSLMLSFPAAYFSLRHKMKQPLIYRFSRFLQSAGEKNTVSSGGLFFSVAVYETWTDFMECRRPKRA